MVHVPGSETDRVRNPQAKQGRRSRRDTNELCASFAQGGRNVLKTLQRIEFTFDLPCCRRSYRYGRSWSTSFSFLRERTASFRVTPRDNVKGRVPMTMFGQLSVVAAYAAIAFVGAIVFGVL
jgi:hypothetical protein